MSLTQAAITAAKPQGKPYKLYGRRGLFLLVRPAGASLWRFEYLFAGRQKLLSLGVYPDVSLKGARERRDQARKLVADHVDPSAKRQAEKSARANTFAAVALEWLETKRATLSESTWNRGRDQVGIVGPVLGHRDLNRS